MTPFGKISSDFLDSSLSMGPFEPPHLLLSNPLANFRQIRRFPRGPFSQLICFRQTLWRIFAKFAIFTKFTAFDRAVLPKSFASSNPLANFRQIRHFRQIRRFPRGPLSQPSCFRQTVWRVFAKFVIFAKFATFTKFAAFDGALLPKSFASSNPLANVRQICRLRQIRRLPRGTLSQLVCFCQTLWQIFTKFAIFAAFTRALLARSFAFVRTLALFRQIRLFH